MCLAVAVAMLITPSHIKIRSHTNPIPDSKSLYQPFH
jgi:hypothetical protein